MPIRLIVFLSIALAAFLVITFLNPDPVSLTLYPDVSLNFPLPVLLMGAFIVGVVSVMLLYFYDALASVFGGFKLSSGRRRLERVKSMREAGAERLLLEDKKEGEKLFRKALAHDPDDIPTLLLLGNLMRDNGVLSEAIKLHSKARGLDGENVSILLELAEDYLTAEQFGNAMNALTETRKLAGRSLPPYVRMRDIYIKAKNWGEALEIQKRIVDLVSKDNASHEHGVLAALIYEGAVEAMADGDIHGARDSLQRALRIDNKFIPAYLKLAEAEDRLGLHGDAVKILENGFKVTRSLIIIKTLEALYFSRGEPEQAQAVLRWAKNVMPGDDMVRLFVAMADFRAGDKISAKEEIDSLNGRLSGMTIYHLVNGMLMKSDNNTEKALEFMDEAYSSEVATLFHFTCSKCDNFSVEYSARCKSCGSWNSLSAVLY